MPPNNWRLNICVFTTESHTILFNAIKDSMRGGTVLGRDAGLWYIWTLSFVSSFLNLKCHFEEKYHLVKIVGEKCCLNLSKNHVFSSVCSHFFPLFSDFIPLLKLLWFWAVVIGDDHGKVLGLQGYDTEQVGGRTVLFSCALLCSRELRAY